MADSYYRYTALTDRGSAARFSFPGYLSSEAPSLASYHNVGSTNLWGTSSGVLQKEINPMRPEAYSVDDVVGIGVHSDPGLGGVALGVSARAYSSPLEDPHLVGQRRDASLAISPSIPELDNERPSSLKNVESLPAHPAGKSNVLFVDGLPTDCTRREVGHLFRPFIGFKDIKVVHKEPRHSGDRAMVLCFVEFIDPKCALTAMEALEGYKFDDKKPDSPVLKIHFAHFPFHLPHDHDDSHAGVPR